MKTVVRILNYIRLAAFPLGYGLTGALVGGTLNRIMIAELQLPATLVGFFLAVPMLISPVRTWLGYRSDGFPVFGRRREPYIIAGALLAGLGVIAAVLFALNTAAGAAAFAGLVLAFVLYGIGRNLGHNTFEALLADTFTGNQRPRAMTAYEVATLLGLVMGSGALGRALEVFDPARLLSVTLGATTIAFGLAFVGAVGQEPVTATHQNAAEAARREPFGKVMREVVLADRQVRLFFVLILFTFVGTLAQDVLLEPYGALALKMPVGDTTRLTAFWGLGVMASMLVSGAILIKWLGYMTVLRVGLVASALVFVGVIAAGATGNAGLFRGMVVLMGLGTGLAGAGLMTGFITFTTSIRAGLLMGVWGMANLIGRAFGSLMGGGVVDVMQSATGGNALVSYATVFGAEVVMLLIALGLSFRLDVAASRAQVEERNALAVTGSETSPGAA